MPPPPGGRWAPLLLFVVLPVVVWRGAFPRAHLLHRHDPVSAAPQRGGVLRSDGARTRPPFLSPSGPPGNVERPTTIRWAVPQLPWECRVRALAIGGAAAALGAALSLACQHLATLSKAGQAKQGPGVMTALAAAAMGEDPFSPNSPSSPTANAPPEADPEAAPADVDGETDFWQRRRLQAGGPAQPAGGQRWTVVEEGWADGPGLDWMDEAVEEPEWATPTGAATGWTAAAEEAEQLDPDWRTRRPPPPGRKEWPGAGKGAAQPTGKWASKGIPFKLMKDMVTRDLEDLEKLKELYPEEEGFRNKSMFMEPKEDEMEAEARLQRWRARRVIAYSEDDIWVDPKDLEPPPKPRPKPEALRDLHKATTAEEIVDAMMADLDILGDKALCWGVCKVAKMLVPPAQRTLRADLLPDLEVAINRINTDWLSEEQRANLFLSMALLFGGMRRSPFHMISAVQRCLVKNFELDWFWLNSEQRTSTMWSCDRLEMERFPEIESYRTFLPFRVHHFGLKEPPLVDELLQEVALQPDARSTAAGRPHGVAWQTAMDPALVYHDGERELWAPHAGFTPQIRRVAAACEALAARDLYRAVRFDAVAVRFQPEGERQPVRQPPHVYSHPDWDATTVIASIGDTCKFCFMSKEDPKERHEFYLFHGDVLHVTGDLSRYWHVTRPCATDTRRRISLVFKCRRPPDLPPHLRGPTATT